MSKELSPTTHCAQTSTAADKYDNSSRSEQAKALVGHNFLLSNMNMMFKIFIAFAVLQLSSASLEEDEYALGVQLHQRAPIPGNLMSLPQVDASLGHLHLSVNTGTPGVWYTGNNTVC